MRFKLDVKITGKGWQAQVIDPKTGDPFLDPTTGVALLSQPRELRATNDHPERLTAFPLPPQAEVDGLLKNESCYDLLTATDGGLLGELYTNIVIRRSPREKDMERFGRYLFLTILGDELWGKIVHAADKERLDVALCFSSQDHALNRLPWEMMYGPKYFLAAEFNTAFTRQVADATHQLDKLVSPPRALFVIGSDLMDPEIRPGAEYLSLIRGLKSQSLGLNHHLLLKATTESLTAAVEWFKPTVVHFICHGGINDDGAGYLRLVDEKAPEKFTNVLANPLLQLLRPNDKTPLPQIVVLNACFTATVLDKQSNELKSFQAGHQVAVPFAVELVQHGIPIVVGMGGEIADQACRLFTRRFYESLLQDGDIAFAAAVGRRAGIMGKNGTDPRVTVDWALPTLFMSSAVSSLTLDVKQKPQDIKWHAIANNYATPGFPAFCGRLDALQLCDLLMANKRTQATIRQNELDMQMLAVSISEADSAGDDDERARYGRSWLLKEFAAKAVRDGHVPCLVDKDSLLSTKLQWPTTFADLINCIRRASLITSARYGLPPMPWRHIEMLKRLKKGDPSPPDMHPDIVANYLENDPAEPSVLATAVRLDLLQLLEQVRALRPKEEQAGTKLLLLVDDVHKMGRDAASDFCNHLLGPFGLRTANEEDARSSIRVIFSHAAKALVGQEDAVKAITDWLGGAAWAASVSLDKFKPPLENRLAYEYFLLNWKNKGQTQRIVPMRGKDAAVQLFFQVLTHMVGNIPSKLASTSIACFVEANLIDDPTVKDATPIRLADDDDVLQEIQF